MRYSKQLDDMLRKNYEEQLEMAKKYDELMKQKKERKAKENFVSEAELAEINSRITNKTNSLNSYIEDIKNNINVLDTRVSILEAAEPIEKTKRNLRKLRITVSA